MLRFGIGLDSTTFVCRFIEDRRTHSHDFVGNATRTHAAAGHGLWGREKEILLGIASRRYGRRDGSAGISYRSG